jgi:HAE1 family hydrophobic/amphiphilic exporter-1
MLSRFFLDRPVFAWVIAIVMMVAGAMAIYTLPISQYPPIAPPSISIVAAYPGASAETVENTVTQIIEQKMTGFDKMLYMSATSDSSGTARLELTFAPGTDPDMAWAQVQNKLQLAEASLPDVVQQQGVQVSKSTRNYLLIIGIISENDSMDGVDLRDFAQSTLEKVVSRIPGVGEVQVFGSQYSMRIWMNPDKLTEFEMTVDDLVAALRAYNVEISAGQFGGVPQVAGQRLNASIIVQNLLTTPDEFAAIPVRSNPDGSIIRLGDVARIEMGSESYNTEPFYNGKPSAVLAVRQASGANALDTANAIRSKMIEMEQYFPAGVKIVYPYDTTPFVSAAIHEVVKTLFEAIILVFLVMYLFMGNMRATLIPTIAVPVVILGTFAVLGLFGFSINMLTMFAMVLAIGLLVDDAIVVVENVERVMSEEGLQPWEATRKSMDQITPALIGIGLVLSAVFGPMAFFQGSTGVIYRQFSVTIIAAMMLSVIVALVLTPVLCATLLKPVAKGHEPAESGVWFLRPFFRWFDHLFNFSRDTYMVVVARTLAKKLRYLLLFVLICGGLVYLFQKMPTAYLPDEDQGIMFVQAALPPNSTMEQTKAVMKKVSDYLLKEEAVSSCMIISGQNFSGNAQNAGMAFVQLKDWAQRDEDRLRIRAVAQRAMAEFMTYKEAFVFAFAPPAVIELGTAEGFDFQLVDRGGMGHEKLIDARNQILGMAAQNKALTKVRPNGLEDVPEYRIDVDWEKAGAMGVPIKAIHSTISSAFGSAYVNDFIQGGRVKRVFIQNDAPYRMLPEDLKKLYVRNTAGEMAPFASIAKGYWSYGSPKLERFNGFPSVNIQGESTPGESSGTAMQLMEDFTGKLPKGFGYDWTGLSYQERQAGSQAGPLYAFSVLVIFLCLAALYESWPIPIAILLVLPLGLIGGVIGSTLRDMPNDVYCQIGLLTTLGLTTKNAILIVQFAKARVNDGMDLAAATLEAAKLRLRPIIMTSLAFGFGVIPLAIATGPGAGAQKAIGTATLGGVVTSTLLVTIFAPLFYVLIQKTIGRRELKTLQAKHPSEPDTHENP